MTIMSVAKFERFFRRRSERRARSQLQDSRPDAQASPDEALGYGVRSVRSAAVKGGNGMPAVADAEPVAKTLALRSLQPPGVGCRGPGGAPEER